MIQEEKKYFERSDYTKITKLLENLKSHNRPHIIQFLSELNNAEIVEDGGLPENIASINSYIKYRYVGKDNCNEAILVFPPELSSNTINVSILSPLGLALIGRRTNSTSEYTAPGGIYRVKIEEVCREKQYSSI